MNKRTIACHPDNYGGRRNGPVRYIVVHYTAGDGDTARDNGLYFSGSGRGASAHWFVDDEEAVASVPEKYVAWHCGAAVYRHPQCRNSNSLGVELCSRINLQGTYYFTPRTLENGAELVRELMRRYDVPVERVLRHYDVTGKLCPAPLVEAGPWEVFREALMRYETLEQIPDWGKAAAEKLLEKGYLTGTGQGLDLSSEMLRLLVILDRAGVFDRD